MTVPSVLLFLLVLSFDLTVTANSVDSTKLERSRSASIPVANSDKPDLTRSFSRINGCTNKACFSFLSQKPLDSLNSRDSAVCKGFKWLSTPQGTWTLSNGKKAFIRCVNSYIPGKTNAGFALLRQGKFDSRLQGQAKIYCGLTDGLVNLGSMELTKAKDHVIIEYLVSYYGGVAASKVLAKWADLEPVQLFAPTRHNPSIRIGKIGTSLVEFAIFLSIKCFATGKVRLESKDSAVPFYEGLGFVLGDDDYHVYVPDASKRRDLEQKFRGKLVYRDMDIIPAILH